MKLLAGIILAVVVFTSCEQKTEWNIANFGAIADNKTVNTEAIQSAIDACFKAGGGVVKIESGTYLSGTVLLKDNVTLHVVEGAKLMASKNPNDFYSIDPFIDATGQYRGQCFIGAMDAENITITGKGIIDGQGEMFTPANVKKTLEKLGVEMKQPDMSKVKIDDGNYINKNIRASNRPFLVRLVRTKNVKLKDITLRQAAAWTLHFYQCQQFEVDGIKIYSHTNKNNDGIDIDSSNDGVIRNCHIDSGDDAICFKSTSPKPSQNVQVYNCKLKSHWGAIKFGTESMGDFRDITIKNCYIYDTRGGGIKVLSVDGANINNVLIDSIQMENVEMPIFIRLGERGLVYRGAPKQPVGSITNVIISNVTAVSRAFEDLRLAPTVGFFFTGTPNHKIENLKLENIKITLPGGGTEENAKIEVPENEIEYPEFTKLGVTPAYGMYARHIDGMVTKNISFITKTEDKRKEIVLVDVNRKRN